MTQRQKGFIPLLIIIIVSIVAVSGIGYGVIEYHKTSKMLSEAGQLTKEEKYDEAIKKLEIAQNRLFSKIILKQKISTELDTNKKLLEDKSEYAQGIEEFEKGDWEEAKELLSRVSEDFPHYQEAKNKIEEAEKKAEEVEKKAIKATCQDGTLYEQCSTNKPKYCQNGSLVDKCPTCGCPSGKQCQSNGSCTVPTQATCQNECSPIGSKRCSDNDYQVCGNYDSDDCLEWGPITSCPVNTFCQNGNCVQQKCLDGTLYGQCSIDKPKYCENGILVDKCSICGCASNGRCLSTGSCFIPFTIKTYSLSQLKIAFLELEAANSIAIEVTKENILPFFLKFKEYIEGASNGKTIVNSDYIILPKETVSIPITNGTADPNLLPIVDDIIKKYENTYIGYTLVIIVDAPFNGPSGLNYDRSNKLHTVIIALGDFYDPQTSLHEEFIYHMAHEILHSFNQARIIILDAYHIFDITKLPKLNSRDQDLHGGYQFVYPFGASLVKLGWRDYNIIEPKINVPIQFVVENSCLPTSKINKIPLGYVNLDGEWLLKSIIVELRGFSDCKLDKYLTPGVNLHYIYENSDVVKYSYPIPVTLPNYYFALYPTNHYYDDEGWVYHLPDINDEKRLTEFSGPEFDFKILKEEWINKQAGNTDLNRLTIHDRFISSAVQFIIKQFSTEIPY